MDGKVLYLSFLWFWITSPQLASSVSVRLINGSSFEGRVEVLYNGVWGTICNNYWDMNDANVVCRMLGHQNALSTTNFFGQGTGQIWLDRVTCFGSESSIDQCCHKEWGNHSCGHYQDAGVVCQPRGPTNITARLISDGVPYAGRVEVRYYGIWKPICDYSWNLQNARVICRMVGYNQSAAIPIKKYRGSGNVWLTYVYCRGSESSIDQCYTHRSRRNSRCNDNRLAGVACVSGTPNITFRLASGMIYNEGRLELRYYGLWGTVCTYIDIKDANVACRMMGYSQAAMIYKQPGNNNSTYRFSLRMYCNGQENSIEQCRYYYINQINACNNWDVWVVCKSPVHASNITVRLTNGSTPNQGRVEVRYHGVWGTVCTYSGLADAHVICRMLNYSKAAWAGTALVKGTGPIVSYGSCNGNEKSLEFCNNYNWAWHYCSHNSDLAVRCANLTKEELAVTVRLIGEKKHVGQVEVNYNGISRPVCGYKWDILDAHVICRMLGYKAALASMKQYLARNRVYKWLSGLLCNGDETSIGQCSHSGWSNRWCNGNSYASVVCKVDKDPPPVQVRLENASSPNSGRVAVRYGNVWGTICPWGLDMNDAKVICRMLGYPGAIRVTTTYMYRYRRDVTAWLSRLRCNGTENSIVDCHHPQWGQTTCSHTTYYHVNVICRKADAPHFHINGTNAITDSTVVILFNDSQTFEPHLQSFYQVAVKVRETEHVSKSHDKPGPFRIKEVDYSKAVEMGHDSYITAEITRTVSKFTIGDSQYYHGYYNAPLEPGYQYRVYIRIVNMKTVDKGRFYGDTAFVAFTTKPKADAAQFQVNGNNAITQSTVEILFKNSQAIETQQSSVYEVVVENRGDLIKSYDQTFVYREVNVTMAMKKHYDNYITAVIMGNVSKLTIGDGRYYHGYYNAPLEPGSMYRVHVRMITMAMHGKKVYGHSSYLAFTTKPFASPNQAKLTSNGSGKVIGLSVVIVILIVLVVGVFVWYILRKRRRLQDGATNEMSEIQEEPGATPGHLSPERLGKGGFNNPAYNWSIKENKTKRKKSETQGASNEPSQNQPWPMSSDFSGIENQGYNLSDIQLQAPNVHKVDGCSLENETC